MKEQPALAIDSAGWLADSPRAGAVTIGELRALSARLDSLRERLHRWRDGDSPSFLALPYATDTMSIANRGRDIAKRFRQTVVFGIGGSSLGGEMLCQVLGSPGHGHPVQFFDNIDPASLDALTRINWNDTQLLVVSKSGTTAETLCQFLSLLPGIEQQVGTANLRKHVLAITENPGGALHRIADQLGIEILPHPPVGGRYSVLSVVGLLPAAIAGVDITALLAGARQMAERCIADDIETNPAFSAGGIQFLHSRLGRTLTVQMTYSDRLRPVMRWFRQLWAESLGKRDRAGHAQGLTPIEAYGATDQHSQLQLYLAGPDDKLFTFLVAPPTDSDHRQIADRFPDIPEAAVLAGHSMTELFAAEFEATRTTLGRNGRPNRTLTLRAGDPAALGELIMLLEVETVVVAELLGVDPFDQPAVEEGKILAREYLAQSRR